MEAHLEVAMLWSVIGPAGGTRSPTWIQIKAQ